MFDILHLDVSPQAHPQAITAHHTPEDSNVFNIPGVAGAVL